MKSLALSLLLLLPLVGCGSGHLSPTVPGSDPAPGTTSQPQTGTVTIRAVFAEDGRADLAEIAHVLLTVSGAEMNTLSAPLRYDAASRTATGTVAVPRGEERKFRLDALEEGGYSVLTGHQVADVIGGSVTSVTLDLYPAEEQSLLPLGSVCLCYGPFRDGQDPDLGVFPSENQIAEDLALLWGRAGVTAIRTYGTGSGLQSVPRLAHQAGLDCLAGAWVSDDEEATRREVDAAAAAANAGYCKAVIVGSEVLLRGSPDANTLLDHLAYAKQRVAVPVAYADTYHALLSHPEVVQAADLVLVHGYPYWEGVDLAQAPQKLVGDFLRVKAAYPDKQVILGETGWPSAGESQGGAVPSPENQRDYLARVSALLRAAGETDCYLFEAFDEKWKVKNEGEVGAHWGVIDSNRQLKPEIASLL